MLLQTTCKNNIKKIMVFTIIISFYLHPLIINGQIKTKKFQFLNIEIATNKACYKPGEQVIFSLKTNSFDGMRVRYKHLNKTIKDSKLTSSTWSWQPPKTDYCGYSVEIYKRKSEKTDLVYAVIGVDVSSDWKKFPRYGFLSDYSRLTKQQSDSVIENLNRFHINGIQFYDWQNKHHMPLPVIDNMPANRWKDIANRDIYLNTVENYISAAHLRNIKAMFYDLVYGTWNQSEKDGVQKDWFIFSDSLHQKTDSFSLQLPFISNLYFTDPANLEWQDYMKKQTNIVYQYLNFDGYHMDQVGDRGIRYKYDGTQMFLNQSFGSYINAIKHASPQKYIVMNAVNQYGQESIAKAASDFLYTEVWDPHTTFEDISNIIKYNNKLSNNSKNTVLAAYMNYTSADQAGFFNTPSILFTDAVIMAFGGSHLELGEHMLCKEYFPNHNLSMTNALKNNLIHYYDFMTAYQNLLRDGGNFNTIELTSLNKDISLAPWPAQQSEIAFLGKRINNKQTINLINFTNSTTQDWRDNKETQIIPDDILNIKLVFTCDSKIKKIWFASPDYVGGASFSLDFRQTKNQVQFTIPYLKYWDMIVIEY